MLSVDMKALLARFAKPVFVVANTVKLSLNGFGDPDERRYAMKLWCRDQCAQGWTKRWADTPEEAWFEFESEMDALMFFLRWR